MFDLSGLSTPQRLIIEDALARTSFPWNELEKGLVAKTGRTRIPVLFSDLSRYVARVGTGSHSHIHEGGDVGHPVAHGFAGGRKRVLGLAWYSGKVEVARELELEPELAKEVFLAEGAHMVDFFYMTEAHRRELWLAAHAGDATEHAHEWFDNPSYWDDVGEAFMAMFIEAYAPTIQQTMPRFEHHLPGTPDELGAVVRSILTPEPVAPAPVYTFIGTRRTGHRADCVYVRLAQRFNRMTYVAPMLETDRRCRRCKP